MSLTLVEFTVPADYIVRLRDRATHGASLVLQDGPNINYWPRMWDTSWINISMQQGLSREEKEQKNFAEVREARLATLLTNSIRFFSVWSHKSCNQDKPGYKYHFKMSSA